MEIDDPATDLATYRRHADELTRYATVLVGPADAADVVTEAVLGAFGARAWRDVENRRAYLYRAVLNRAMSHRRSEERRRRREMIVAFERPAVMSGAGSEGDIDAHRALAQLSPQQRAVVYLTYWEDLGLLQIATTLEITEGAVRKQLVRARDHLRRILDV